MNAVVHVTSADFEQVVLASDLPVLVDFWADWCGPCKSLAPILDKIALDYEGRLTVAKVNVDEEQQIAGAAGIRSLPTMMMFVDGRPVEQIVGAQPDANIRAVIDRFMGAEEDAIPPELEGADAEQSIEKLQALLAEDPDNQKTIAAIARIHIVEGELDKADALLATVNPDAASDDAVAQAGAALWFARQADSVADMQSLQAKLQGGNPGSKTLYQAGIRFSLSGQYDEAAEALLTLLGKDRKFEDDAGRKTLLRLIDLLGPADERVGALRRRMMTLIY